MFFGAALRPLAALARLAILVVVLSAAAPAGAQENFLWSVEDGAGARLFLYGSIHLATPDIYPLPEVVQRAFDNSVHLVVEADVSAPDIASTMSQVAASGTYLYEQTTLWDDIGAELSGDLKKCAVKSGLPPDLFEKLKPWLAAMTLEAMRLKGMGYDDKLGLDLYFIRLAKAKKILIGELESIEEQMEIFTTLTDEESLKLLKVTVLECGESEAYVHELIDVWRQGDLDGFEKIYFQVYNQYPDLAPLLDRVIYDRNDLMHARLQPYLFPGRTTFVVVGAAHMVGPKGLPELFRKQGLKVTRY